MATLANNENLMSRFQPVQLPDVLVQPLDCLELFAISLDYTSLMFQGPLYGL